MTGLEKAMGRRRPHARVVCACALLLTGPWTTPHAAAQADGGAESSAQDAALVTAAEQLDAAGERTGALALLRQLEARRPSAEVAGRIALLQAALDHPREAEAHAQTALRAPDAPWVRAHAEQLEQVLRDSAHRLGTVLLVGLPPGTVAYIGQEQVGIAPAPLRLAAGDVSLSLVAPGGRRGTLHVSVAAQETLRQDASSYFPAAQEGAVTPTPTVPTPTVPTRPTRQPEPVLAAPEPSPGPRRAALARSAASERAWTDFMRTELPRQRERERFARWFEARSRWQLWGGLRLGFTQVNQVFSHSSIYTRARDTSGASFALHMGASYDLGASVQAGARLRFTMLGSYGEHWSEELSGDPVYRSVSYTTEGNLYAISLVAMLRFSPHLRRPGSSFYGGLGGELGSQLYAYHQTSEWSRGSRYGPRSVDVGTPIDGVNEKLLLRGLLEVGAYLGRRKNVDVGVDFLFNGHAWTLGATLSVSFTGWSSLPPDGDSPHLPELE